VSAFRTDDDRFALASCCRGAPLLRSIHQKVVTMRSFPRMLRFWTALVVILHLGAFAVAPATAGLVASQVTGTTDIASVRDADMQVVQRALENKVVAQKLADYGVAAEDAQLKLATMSDSELHTLASATPGLPTGADGTTGAIIGVLVVVILVIIVLKLMNRQVVVR